MRSQNVRKAIMEAKRFVNAADDWIERCANDSMAQYASKEGGTIRRASLDLTRALAELR